MRDHFRNIEVVSGFRYEAKQLRARVMALGYSLMLTETIEPASMLQGLTVLLECRRTKIRGVTADKEGALRDISLVRQVRNGCCCFFVLNVPSMVPHTLFGLVNPRLRYSCGQVVCCVNPGTLL